MASPNKVWIEIQYPKYKGEGEARANLMSNMLKKLGETIPNVIWWHETKKVYCVTIDHAGSYLEMVNNGHWFNLDYLARVKASEPI